MLRNERIPVTIRELLTLLDCLDKDVISNKIDDFYYLSRSTLIKDEKYIDRFDKVFGFFLKALINLNYLKLLILLKFLMSG